jgi:hypothetical protein
MKFDIIDLSPAIENDIASDPPGMLPQIAYVDHDASFERLAAFFPGFTRAGLPDGAAWAIETVQKFNLSNPARARYSRASHQQSKGGDPVSYCQSPRSPASVNWILAFHEVRVA